MPAPKSLSSAQKPVMTEAGTPNSACRALERGAMLGDLALARLHAVRRRQLGLEVEEAHDEDGALLAVAPDDAAC